MERSRLKLQLTAWERKQHRVAASEQATARAGPTCPVALVSSTKSVVPCPVEMASQGMPVVAVMSRLRTSVGRC